MLCFEKYCARLVVILWQFKLSVLGCQVDDALPRAEIEQFHVLSPSDSGICIEMLD
jgi:hypothetical protein